MAPHPTGSGKSDGEVLATDPMQLVGRPKLAKQLPKALPRTAVEALLETVAPDQGSISPGTTLRREA
ncbi:MAG: hypothetical protein QOJ56_6252, partial [Mycobacterium sp.]|nr:hypothetical protein [Mycobacterium sp.]